MQKYSLFQYETKCLNILCTSVTFKVLFKERKQLSFCWDFSQEFSLVYGEYPQFLVLCIGDTLVQCSSVHGCITAAVMMEVGIYRGLVVIIEHLITF